MISDLIDICKTDGNYSPLVRVIGEVFSDWRQLNKSFLLDTVTPDTPSVGGVATGQLSQKELERKEDEEKETDDVESSGNNPGSSSSTTGESSSSTSTSLRTDNDTHQLTVDVASARRAFASLYALEEERVQNALLNAVVTLAQLIEVDMRWVPQFTTDPHHLNVFVLMMENEMLQSPEYLDVAFPIFCRAAGQLPQVAQVRLAKIWSRFPADQLLRKLQWLQQLISFKVLSDHGGIFRGRATVNEDDAIRSATKVMRIIYYASVIGGELTKPSVIAAEDEFDISEILGAVGHENKERKIPKEDPFATELKCNVQDSRKPLIAFNEFYNEPLNEQIEVDHDFTCYKKDEKGQFSFLNFPFILTPASKNMGLYYDNRIRMYNERRLTVLNSLVQGDTYNPYLKLKVRRDHVVDDSLVRVSIAFVA